MLRKVLQLLLLLAVLNHGTAMPGSFHAGIVSGQESSHAALHWQGVAHHHHDDGSVHTHEAVDSAQHLQIDDLMQCPALAPALEGSSAAAAKPIEPAPPRQPRRAAACLDVPERPPRTLS
jgi:hypothetical protein